MARRVVIEEECPIHGGYGPHWSSGQQNSNGPYRTCQMSQRRVLDPGSYVVAEACPVCDHQWKEHDPDDGRCDAYPGGDHCNGFAVVAAFSRTALRGDALAGGERP